MTGRDRTDLDTGAKPGHAMLPDMGSYHDILWEGYPALNGVPRTNRSSPHSITDRHKESCVGQRSGVVAVATWFRKGERPARTTFCLTRTNATCAE